MIGEEDSLGLGKWFHNAVTRHFARAQLTQQWTLGRGIHGP